MESKKVDTDIYRYYDIIDGESIDYGFSENFFFTEYLNSRIDNRIEKNKLVNRITKYIKQSKLYKKYKENQYKKQHAWKLKLLQPIIDFGNILGGEEYIIPETIGYYGKKWGKDINFKVIKPE
jgi:benzoyl-CoA reductase/2-hydroxyglutaryl-CoA dehydratase subunit BcrC/BadD/HgdB